MIKQIAWVDSASRNGQLEEPLLHHVPSYHATAQSKESLAVEEEFLDILQEARAHGLVFAVFGNVVSISACLARNYWFEHGQAQSTILLTCFEWALRCVEFAWILAIVPYVVVLFNGKQKSLKALASSCAMKETGPFFKHLLYHFLFGVLIGAIAMKIQVIAMTNAEKAWVHFASLGGCCLLVANAAFVPREIVISVFSLVAPRWKDNDGRSTGLESPLHSGDLHVVMV